MNLKKILLSAVIFSLSAISANAQEKRPDFSAQFKNLPFRMKQITVPKFPDKSYNIKKYGAVGDGLFLNTKAFEKAIEDCSKNGGGKVIVPAGIWLTGPIYLKSNINLYLEKGALIQFTTDVNEYPIVESNWEGYAQYRCASPIMGKNLKNIAITGNGIIDGAGQVWRPVKKFKLTENEWKALVKSGGVIDKKGDTWWPSKEALEASTIVSAMKEKNEALKKEEAEKYKLFFRPVLLNFVECQNIWLDGVTFQNSPAWNLHPLLCENVIVNNVNVRNAWYSQNGDGIDIESCRNILLYNSRFDVGDDAICIKSGRDEEGRKRGRPTENLIITNCVVYHGHGGVTVGSEMSGGVKNVKVDNCNFIGTDVGLRFKSNRGRGGVVENIWISNIYMKDIPTEALSFNLYYGGLAPAEDKSVEEKMKDQKTFAAGETTPSFRNIYLKNIFCNSAKDAVVLQGLPEMPIRNIEIDNVVFSCERGISIYDADGIKITNAKIYSSAPVVKINQSVNVALENITVKEDTDVFISLLGAKTGKIHLAGKNADQLFKKARISSEVTADALKVK
jgi:polygalacturonase